MSSQLIPFNFEAKEIRVLTDESNQPWFVAKDVCELLGYADHKKALSMLDTDEGSRIPLIDSLGREQETLTINESGLYTLIIRSNKPKAKEFRKWVTSVVLPSIRKTGSYSINQESPIIDVLPEPEPEAMALVKPESVNQLEYLKANSDLVYKNVKHFKGIAKDLLHLKDNELTLSVVNAIKQTHHNLDLLKVFNPSTLTNPSESANQYLVRQEEPHYNPTELAKILREPWTPRSLNTELAKQGFQVKSKANDKWEPTEKSFLVDRDSSLNLGCWVDTGKAHHSGLPVTTFRWYARVLDVLDKSEIENLVSAGKSKNGTSNKKLKPSQPQETFLN